ncbi:unnamed protein product [Gongylonema pulchrum]|nr:unnamed protein product [Gongylonema pulchrum]
MLESYIDEKEVASQAELESSMASQAELASTIALRAKLTSSSAENMESINRKIGTVIAEDYPDLQNSVLADAELCASLT